MRTAGKFLIFSAVVLRAVVVLSEAPEFQVVISLLAAFGLIMVVETWLVHSTRPWFVQFPILQPVYLFLQSILVLSLLLVSSYEDFLAELFIPLSLDAVSFFGKKTGFRIIALFSLAMTGVLLFSPEGPLFGLAMGILYSSLCFAFGGYANQVEKAESARTQNLQTFHQLQEAHRQLKGYADHRVYLAMEHERNQLARDLHDSVTQTVFSMNLAAQSACLLWVKEPGRLAGLLSRLDELATSAQHEIQTMVSQLTPHSTIGMGLPAALRKLADEQRVRNGLNIALEIQGEGNVSETEAAHLYAIAHEALTNIAKHSGSCNATVRLLLGNNGCSMEVEDYGRGFDTQARLDQRSHLGLAGMFERAQEMGWNLTVDSQPGRGTRIRVFEGIGEERR